MGLAGIAVPIIIHLLLRQRPRPRPWAAMRWLLAAQEAASRRYKLTNLLLLLLRCLAVALLALALSQPRLASLIDGGKIIVLVDTTASMGPLHQKPGALELAQQDLQESDWSGIAVKIVSFDGERLVDHSTLGFDNAAVAWQQFQSLESSMLPGGLDDSSYLMSELLTIIPNGSDVLLVSDFRNDTGEGLVNLLRDRGCTTRRWRSGQDGSNAMIASLPNQLDPLPGAASELHFILQGNARQAQIKIGDSSPLPHPIATENNQARVSLPPLPEGKQQLTIELQDTGLLYDDVLELPVEVRPSIPCLSVESSSGYVSAALQAAEPFFRFQSVNAAALASQPLPQKGFMTIRQAVRLNPESQQWLQEGGIISGPYELLISDPFLRECLRDVRVNAQGPGVSGPIRITNELLAPSLAHFQIDNVPSVQLPRSAEVLMQVGSEPFVIAMPVKQGWLIVELSNLDNTSALWYAGVSPLWFRDLIRQFTARSNTMNLYEAGTPAPRSLRIQRQGTVKTINKNEPLRVSPGIWQTVEEQEPIIVLPNQREGRLYSQAGNGIATTFKDAVPSQSGDNLLRPILMALLIFIFLEGMLAAWSGRLYGRAA